MKYRGTRLAVKSESIRALEKICMLGAMDTATASFIHAAELQKPSATFLSSNQSMGAVLDVELLLMPLALLESSQTDRGHA